MPENNETGLSIIEFISRKRQEIVDENDLILTRKRNFDLRKWTRNLAGLFEIHVPCERNSRGYSFKRVSLFC